MAPAPTAALDGPSPRLADYFFISGLDSDQLHWETEEDAGSTHRASALVDATIKEDKLAEAVDGEADVATPTTARRAKRSSYNRLSKLSDDRRLSIASSKAFESGGNRGADSNRSSATIKGPQSNGRSTFSEADFDRALRKFASERDNFVNELTLSAGAVVREKPKPRTKPQRIFSEDVSALKSGLGSIRRRISFREMGSIKRQPSVARQPSVRTSKRLSNYNSVIPSPTPLNADPHMHPLKRKFEPVLLDRYPAKHDAEQLKRRVAFPDYVPMFAFPADLAVVSADARPRSTWHGFAMTLGDGARLYGVCVTVWLPLQPAAAAELERQCERWRRLHMSDEERELASSLGERLAAERATLSRLLARLPTAASGSEERERLEDDISAVEEKIALMTDLLRPVRHGAASKIDGLTDGDSGFWIPRAYGVLGRDPTLTAFWKEWLRAVVVPMAKGGVLRVPPSSPRSGMWQPLERYVVNLCAEALCPVSSKTQVEIAIRELRLFARKEAENELPGSRNSDLYALFRALSIPQIVILFEYVLAESRIILISSHTSMLHLVSRAIVELLYPFTWAGIFIPVLPYRLLQAIEAPCPYIVGIEKRYENIEFPSEDFVVVDLDANAIESTAPPHSLPRQQRRKLTSLLQMAAPHHNRFGVQPGPPAYAVESFPWDAFSTENPQVFSGDAAPTSLAKYAGLNSASFGDNDSTFQRKPPIFNAFLHGRENKAPERPGTTSTLRESPPSSLSPTSAHFPSSLTSRNDSGFALQATLREKRSGHFDSGSRRSSSFGVDRHPTFRRPSIPMIPPTGHQSNPSVSTILTMTDSGGAAGTSSYAPSVMAPSTYAASTLAASTIMPHVLYKPVHDSATTCWAEGHCLELRPRPERGATCLVCAERPDDDGLYKCSGCFMHAHARCAHAIGLVCPAAFHAEQVRAAFARCFASLLYTYRKHLAPATGEGKRSGLLHAFDAKGFAKSLPRENAEYVAMLQQTQAFNEFVHERESRPLTDPAVLLFDQIILAKRNRGRTSLFGRAKTNFLSDTSDHLWRNAAANAPTGKVPGEYHEVISRIPAKLDPQYMKEPRVIQGVPRINNAKARRKPIPSMLGPNGVLASSPPNE